MIKLKSQPRPKQIEAAGFTTNREAALINSATGSGKTYIEIMTAARLIKDNKVDKFLFVGTKSSTIEIESDFNTHTNTIPVFIENSLNMQEFLSSDTPIGLIQFNTFEDMALSPIGDGSKKALDEYRIQRIIKMFQGSRVGINIDEIHKIKNPKSRLRQFFDEIRHVFHYHYGYTATALMRNLYDLYYVISYLKPGYFGSYWDFTNRYIIKVERAFGKRDSRGVRRKVKVIARYKNLSLLRSRLAGIMYSYHPKRDISYIPETVPIHPFSIEPYQEAAAGVLDNNRDVEDIEDDDERKTHSARMVDLQNVVDRDKNKLERLVLLAKSEFFVNHGFLLFCSYYEGIDLVKGVLQRAGVSVKEISGRISSREERKKTKEWFVEDPSGKCLIVSKAGGESLNLQATPIIVFYNIPAGIGYFIQIMGRVVRDFSVYDAFQVFFLIVDGTIDAYKHQYIDMHKEDFDLLFSNEVDEGMFNKFSNFNAYVLDGLRKSLLWDAAKK